MKGFFAIGIQHVKTEVNVGTLFRTAYALGASYVFTISKRYGRQASDTCKTPNQIPLFHYSSFDEFYSQMPHGTQLIGIEITESSIPIGKFYHPQAAIYLLGAEDHGLTTEAISKCHKIVQLPGRICLNVATTGGIVIYDRINKQSNGRASGIENQRISPSSKILQAAIHAGTC